MKNYNNRFDLSASVDINDILQKNLDVIENEILDDISKQLEDNFTISTELSLFNKYNQQKEYFKKEYEAHVKINEALNVLENLGYEYSFNAIGITKKGNRKILKLNIIETLEKINVSLFNIVNGDFNDGK